MKTLHVEMSGDEDKRDDRLKAITLFANLHPAMTINMYITDEALGKCKFVFPKNIIPIKCSNFRRSLNYFRADDNDAVYVSAGNTGDILLNAHAVIGTIGGKLTPPILANTFPKIEGHMVFLDMGATLWPEENLMTWITLAGKNMAEVIYGNAKIGLLNIGEEKDKGGKLKKIRETLEKEVGSAIENIEINKAIDSDINILATSGFLGNLVIKTFEGTVKTMYRKTCRGKLSKLTKTAFGALNKISWVELDWKRYSGAYALGLNRPLLITHGRCDKEAFFNALARAIDPFTLKLFQKINNDPLLKKWICKQTEKIPH